MEQGRRAVRHALGLEAGPRSGLVPTGIYTIPEIAMVGIGESQAREAGRPITVGRAHFSELARGQIAGNTHGLLKLIADGEGRKVLGVEVVGDGATDLVHLGQAAIIAGWDVDEFVDNVFNFPTLGEAYRLAALQVVDRRREVPVEA
ncbi:MAG: hypothetical protein R3F20_16060 [Planctomycetota bacterium]